MLAGLFDTKWQWPLNGNLGLPCHSDLMGQPSDQAASEAYVSKKLWSLACNIMYAWMVAVDCHISPFPMEPEGSVHPQS